MRIPSFLNQPVAFAKSWRHALLIGSLLGGLLAAILIFLQPFDTYTHNSPTKNLELAGYAPLILFAVLLIHGPERWIYRKQRSTWRLWQEGLFVALGCLLMLIGAYVYNAWVINDLAVQWTTFWGWLWGIGGPFVIFMAPAWLWLRARFGNVTANANIPEPVTIDGQNKSEQLRLRPADFLYAQSQQNYADIYYRPTDGAGIEKEVLRITLADLQQQLPSAQRVHRSYLVNLRAVESIEGNARKRFLVLREVPEPIPLSQKYYPVVQQRLSDSSQ